jgi:anti-sigma factor RsiW
MTEPLRVYEHGYTCSQVVELATDYVEGAMPAEHRTHFEMHLNFCDGCFTFIDQIRATAATAGRLSEEQVPEEIKGKLLAAFREWRRE